MSRVLVTADRWGAEPSGRADGPDLDLASIERANEAMARLKEEYVAEWAPASLAEMEALVDELTRSSPPGVFAQLYRHAHDMKGQGATFGYGLITQIGEALCRLTAGRDAGSEAEISLLRAHLAAARRILNERLENNGGAAGERIMERLAQLRRRTAH